MTPILSRKRVSGKSGAIHNPFTLSFPIYVVSIPPHLPITIKLLVIPFVFSILVKSLTSFIPIFPIEDTQTIPYTIIVGE